MCLKFVLFLQITLSILSLTMTIPLGETSNPKIKRENSLVYNYHYEEKPEEEPSPVSLSKPKPVLTYKFNIDAKPTKNYQEYYTSYKTKEHSQEIQHEESYGQSNNKYEHHNYVKHHHENTNKKKQSVATLSNLGALNGVVDQEVLDLTNDIVKAIEHNIEKSESQTGETYHLPNSNQKVKVKLWYAGNEDEDTDTEN